MFVFVVWALIFCMSAFTFFRIPPVFASSSFALVKQESTVIEHLRLNVPRKMKTAWLLAEKSSWEPWLKQKKGFLGRQLFWDPGSEEATLLISWASKKDWKKIPQSEINSVQEDFEKIAREELGESSVNPFPLVFEGELLPQ